ncbi:hypothetical protein LTR47_010827 [Exophiala xenobiotica]|nr:hypothetical protein LTR41_011379 [Exophiala xenobiotica]KAK5221587.1 hypothetical protein LTR47_010827 [Exophiala xenobiotica]KAK5345257.1 hypothetical protein LTR61_010978 [Exophiala xenobiotica]KAK5433193.1 hypothetical protein LTR18_010987 [Exophiala xenobiotica]
MRLLEIGRVRDLRLSQDFIDHVPVYAILSHTWRINDSRKRLRKSTERTMELTELGHDSDQFVVDVDLSAIPDAAKFVARENELGEMRRLLQGHKSRSSVVLHGLGGISKTQLAIKYAIRHKEKYTAIFWLNANDEDSLKLSFRRMAQRILEDQEGRPSTRALASVDLDGDLDHVVTAVTTWLNLRRNTRWLMIYDNYDKPRTPGNVDRSGVDIRWFLPRADHGSIIIRTRWPKSVRAIASMFKVEEYS